MTEMDRRSLTISGDTERAARFVRFVTAVTFLYPVLWIVGVAGLYWVIVGIASVGFLLRRRVHGIAAIPIGMAVVLMLSTVVGVVAFGPDIGRLISVLANILVWISVGALLSAGRDVSYAKLMSRAIIFVLVAQGAIVAVAWLVFPAKIGVPILAPILRGLPSGFAAFSVDKLFDEDWLGGRAFRSAGLMGQPTWAGAFAVVAGLVAISILLSRSTSKRWRIVALVGIGCAYFGLALSLSRSGQISLIAGLAVGGLIVLFRRLPLWFYAIATWLIAAALFVVVFGGEYILGYLNQVNGEREGSLQTRGAIYAITFDYVRALGVPILGYGIKPQQDDLVASVATHSAYLGMLFRGGIVGVALFLIFLIALFARSFAQKDALAGAVLSFVIVWCLLEDFDAGHLVPLVVAVVAARMVSRTALAPELDSLRGSENNLLNVGRVQAVG